MIVLAAALWMIQVVSAQLECVDATRAAARAAARGESLEEVRRIALSATRPDARVDVERVSGSTRVRISFQVRPAWGVPLPPVTVDSSAVTATEP